MSTPLSDLLTTSQVARRLHVTPARVLQIVERGQLPHVKSPHGRLYQPEAVDRLAAERAAKRQGRGA